MAVNHRRVFHLAVLISDVDIARTLLLGPLELASEVLLLRAHLGVVLCLPELKNAGNDCRFEAVDSDDYFFFDFGTGWRVFTDLARLFHVLLPVDNFFGIFRAGIGCNNLVVCVSECAVAALLDLRAVARREQARVHTKFVQLLHRHVLLTVDRQRLQLAH